MDMSATYVSNVINTKILEEISEGLKKISYGTLTIVIHNKKVTQIEVLEKKRFDEYWKVEEGGGI